MPVTSPKKNNKKIMILLKMLPPWDGQQCEPFYCYINCAGQAKVTRQVSVNPDFLKEKGEPKAGDKSRTCVRPSRWPPRERPLTTTTRPPPVNTDIVVISLKVLRCHGDIIIRDNNTDTADRLLFFWEKKKKRKKKRTMTMTWLPAATSHA